MALLIDVYKKASVLTQEHPEMLPRYKPLCKKTGTRLSEPDVKVTINLDDNMINLVKMDLRFQPIPGHQDTRAPGHHSCFGGVPQVSVPALGFFAGPATRPQSKLRIQG